MACETKEAYLKEVEKNLDLPKPLRKELLHGLKQELDEVYPFHEELERPEEMAELLMNNVPLEIRNQHQKKKKRRVRTAFAAILVLFALVTGYFLRMEKTQVARAEETITVTEIVNE